MDKSTGNGDSRDTTLGCGPSPSPAPPATAPTQSSTLSTPGTSTSPPSASIQQQISLLPTPITLNIATTTGGNYTVVADPQNSVEILKKTIAKKLKVSKDRISLLFRERELQESLTIKDNGLMEGSKIILIPSVETGLLAQRPENTVMQALESLNDGQVNDFLSGKTPLNLSMRLGDHMMLIQLQLSTVNPSGSSSSNSGSSSSSALTSGGSSSSTLRSRSHHHHHHHHHHHTHRNRAGLPQPAPAAHQSSASRRLDVEFDDDGSHPQRRHAQQGTPLTTNTNHRYHTRNSVINFENTTPAPPSNNRSTTVVESATSAELSASSSASTQIVPVDLNKTCSSSKSSILRAPIKLIQNSSVSGSNSSSAPTTAELEQSPIKSLSNLVSSPIKTTSIKNIPIRKSNRYSTETPSPASAPTTASTSSLVAACSDAISAKLTSCLCARLGCGTKTIESKEVVCEDNSCLARTEGAGPLKPMAASTPNLKSSITPTAHQSMVTKVLNRRMLNGRTTPYATSSTLPASSSSHTVYKKLQQQRQQQLQQAPQKMEVDSTPAGESSEVITKSVSTNTPAAAMDFNEELPGGVTISDTRALAEASRNLTQTLRKLSKDVFCHKLEPAEEIARKSSSGAVIESMKNHGKGIYSGTFSGTLNPALQDRFGRPKRDISTVIHILNDLLSATPHYSRGAKISLESTSTGTAILNGVHTPKYPRNHPKHPLNQPFFCSKCPKLIRPCLNGECINGPKGSSAAGTSTAQTSTTTNSDLSTNLNASSSSSTSSLLANSANNTSSILSTSSSSASTSNSSLSTLSTSSLNSSCILDERTSCACRLNVASGERELCNKCSSELENNKTKYKLDQLRLVMQQRKERREARKLKGAPYGARVVGTTGATTDGAASSTSEPNHIIEEVDSVA